MKKSGAKTASFAWFGLIGLSSIGVLTGILFSGALLLGCVEVNQEPASLQQVDSARSTLRVDSAAIYRCDTCAFAKAYLKQVSAQVKPCESCAWVTLSKPKHDKGDVPELSNPPVDALAEQDAPQHGTSHLVVPAAEVSAADTTPEQPGGERYVERRKPDREQTEAGDGI